MAELHHQLPHLPRQHVVHGPHEELLQRHVAGARVQVPAPQQAADQRITVLRVRRGVGLAVRGVVVVVNT